MVEKKNHRAACAHEKEEAELFWLYALLFLLVLGARHCMSFPSADRRKRPWNPPPGNGGFHRSSRAPERGATEVHLVLPGTVQAEMESSVYAQVSGISNAGWSISARPSKKDNCWRKSKRP